MLWSDMIEKAYKETKVTSKVSFDLSSLCTKNASYAGHTSTGYPKGTI